MPKYAGFDPSELELYPGRRGRRRFGIHWEQGGLDAGSDDLAVRLYEALSDMDPDVAFTPEMADEACKRALGR